MLPTQHHSCQCVQTCVSPWRDKTESGSDPAPWWLPHCPPWLGFSFFHSEAPLAEGELLALINIPQHTSIAKVTIQTLDSSVITHSPRTHGSFSFFSVILQIIFLSPQITAGKECIYSLQARAALAKLMSVSRMGFDIPEFFFHRT